MCDNAYLLFSFPSQDKIFFKMQREPPITSAAPPAAYQAAD